MDTNHKSRTQRKNEDRALKMLGRELVDLSTEIYLKAEPDINASDIIKLPLDSKIKVLENSDMFYRVKVNGYIGYLERRFLKRKY